MEIQEKQLAGSGLRLLNFVIDTIAYLLLWFTTAVLLIVLGLDIPYMDSNGELVRILPLIIVVPVFWIYYILTEYFFQRTLGKLITGTKVVTETGEKPSFLAILGRTLCRSIPFEYVSYLMLVVGIHDSLSKTRVIKTRFI